MSIFLHIAIPALLLFAITTTVSGEKNYEAILKTELQNNMLVVSSLFRNNSADNVNFTYRLKSERIGQAGKSANSQSGSIQARAGQTVELSKTAFSVVPQDSYFIYLEIVDGDKIVARDSIEYKGKM